LAPSQSAAARLRPGVLAGDDSSKGIGRLRVHRPPGERKSGIRFGGDTGAGKGTMTFGLGDHVAKLFTPLRRSDAIIRD